MERTTAGSSGARWLWLTLALVALDRATKRVIERHTSPFFRRPIISDIVVVVHRENPGIAFSVFSDSHSRLLEPMLLLSSAVVIVLLIWVLLKDLVGGWLAQCGVAMILAGATGNALDRVLYGTVTDFLEVRLGAYRWPAFNVADSAITVGAILVGIELLFGNRETLDSAENSRESR